MVPYILYFSVLVAVVNCGAIDRIIGGYPLNIADAPYQVAILASDKMLCSGAILTEKHVLTAAYCVAYEDIYSVKYGSASLKNGGQKIVVEDIHYHPDYKGTGSKANIAIVTLAENIVFSNVAQPAKLASSEPKPGDSLRISGWGSLDESFDSIPDLLQAVYVPLVDFKVCKKLYEPLSAAGWFVWPDNFCTAFDGKGACHYDEGAPVVNERGELVGVHSSRRQCGSREVPDAHMSVKYHMDFIKSVIYA